MKGTAVKSQHGMSVLHYGVPGWRPGYLLPIQLPANASWEAAENGLNSGCLALAYPPSAVMGILGSESADGKMCLKS